MWERGLQRVLSTGEPMSEERKIHFQKACEHSVFSSLPLLTQTFLEQKALLHHFSFSQLQQLIIIAVDLYMWDVTPLEQVWEDKQSPKETFLWLQNHHEKLKNSPKAYTASPHSFEKESFVLQEIQKQTLGLGSCPVASPKTRCCNLLTLDAVESCGFDCSYCSIQSFYKNNTITFDKDFAKKLENLILDPHKTYHIGTGQSSDSLMWGNRAGVLEALLKFAKKHPNVILEFKSKSDNITYLLEQEIPKNVICTWSLNPQVIIDHEEKRTASLHARIHSARLLADKGVLVGFHFHPIVLFDGWQSAYCLIIQELLASFSPEEVALVSMGTLTFIKPVLKKIRLRAQKSKILQMPLCDANGKYSYPLAQKKEMFQTLYRAFAPWHDTVFFYLCMEDECLWKEVFGYEFENNEAFEKAMIRAYTHKRQGRK